MSSVNSEDSLDFLLSLQNQEDFWLASSSILLTPPDSVENPSQDDYTSLPSVSNSNTFEEDDNSFMGNWDDYEYESDEESECESSANLNFHATSLQELQILTDLHKFVGGNAAKLDERVIDFFIGITNVEWEILAKLEELKETLSHLIERESQLVESEIERMSKNIIPLNDEKAEVETLIHTGDINPIVYNTPFPSKYPYCRRDRRLEMSPEVQYGFKTAILTSVVVQKLNRTSARFEGLLMEAGATEEQILWLRQRGYHKAYFSELIVRTPKLQESTVSPVVQTWYSSDGKLQAVARSSMTVFDLYKWKARADKIDKQTTLNDIFSDTKTEIDWMHVSNLMLKDFGFEIDPFDCELLWKCVLNPANDRFQWTQQSLRRLQKIVQAFGEQNWDIAAKCMGHEVSPFMCFVMYTNFIQSNFYKVLEAEFDWSIHEKEVVVNEIRQGGNYGTAASALNKYFPERDYRALSAKACFETTLKYKKESYETVSPVEDALLMVTMEKFSDLINHPQIARQGPLPIGKMLNWRSNYSWTHRLRILFDEFIQPWTVQDEFKLVCLAQEFPNDWTLIAQEFDGTYSRYRTRTSLRTHYVKLLSILKENSYIEYRREYQEVMRKELQYSALWKAYDVLLGLKSAAAHGKVKTFRGLPRNYPPNDVDLSECLLSAGQEWISLAIQRIEQFLDVKVVNNSSPASVKPKVEDRRTFHREDPKSVASAMHIRRLQVKPFLEVNELSKFEQMVIFHLDCYYKNHKAKYTGNHCNIPTTNELRSLPELSRILKRPIFEMIDGQKVKDYLSIKPTNVKNNVDHTKNKLFQNCGCSFHSMDLVVPNDESACSSQTCEDPLDSFGINQSTQAEIKLAHIPKLRETKGNRASRLSNIRRMIAKNRWLSRNTAASTTEQSAVKPVMRKPKKGVCIVPLEDLQEEECDISSDNSENKNSTPSSPTPVSPLKELTKNIYLTPTLSPQKRPKRDSKAPKKLVYK